MRKLYHSPRARSFRVLWMLEEIGLTYDLGTVPLYVEGDVRMTESSAICQFLASGHADVNFSITSDEPDFGDSNTPSSRGAGNFGTGWDNGADRDVAEASLKRLKTDRIDTSLWKSPTICSCCLTSIAITSRPAQANELSAPH